MALEHPTSKTFPRVIGLSNRPLTLGDSFLPEVSRLPLISGIDLSGDLESTVVALKRVEGIEKTTHVYFTGESSKAHQLNHPNTILAYIHEAWGADGSQEEVRANVELLMNSVKAVNKLCPNLQFVTWPSGGKWYMTLDYYRLPRSQSSTAGMATSMHTCSIPRLHSRRRIAEFRNRMHNSGFGDSQKT